MSDGTDFIVSLPETYHLLQKVFLVQLTPSLVYYKRFQWQINIGYSAWAIFSYRGGCWTYPLGRGLRRGGGRVGVRVGKWGSGLEWRWTTTHVATTQPTWATHMPSVQEESSSSFSSVTMSGVEFVRHQIFQQFHVAQMMSSSTATLAHTRNSTTWFIYYNPHT